MEEHKRVLLQVIHVILNKYEMPDEDKLIFIKTVTQLYFTAKQINEKYRENEKNNKVKSEK